MEHKKKPVGGEQPNKLPLFLDRKRKVSYSLYRWDKPEEVLYRVNKESTLRLLVEEAMAKGVSLDRVNLTNAYLYGLTTPKTHRVMRSAKLDWSLLAYSQWTLVDLSYSSIQKAVLTGSQFRMCVFEEVDFEESDLTRCRFVECRFVRCNFKNTVAKKTKFYKCLFDRCLSQPDLGFKSHLIKTQKIDF